MYDYHILSIGSGLFLSNGEEIIRAEAQKGWRLVTAIPPPPEHPRMAISLFGLPLISVLPQSKIDTSFRLRDQYKLIFERVEDENENNG
jgi:hypothetical protein